MKKSIKFVPLGVCWEITSSCNYHCPFCYAKKEKMLALTFNQQKKALHILKKEGVKYISFTGGEPLFVKKVDDLILYAKKLGFFVKLCTNGSMLTKKFIKKVKNSLDMISLPLDGSTNKLIETIRGEKDHFSKFIYCMNILKGTKIKVVVNTLVTKENGPDLTNILKVLNKFSNVYEWKLLRYYYVDYKNKKYITFKKDYLSLISRISKSNVPFKLAIKPQRKKDQNTFILLDEAGYVYVKSNHKRYLIGNIFTHNIKKILTASEYFSKELHMKKYSKYLSSNKSRQRIK